MMNLEGYEVVHKAFGNGIIQRIDHKYVTVKFANIEKTFVYPDVFEKFLKLDDDVDSAAKEEVNNDLLALKAKRENEAKEKEHEKQLQMQGIVIPGSRINLENQQNNYSQPEDISEEI